MSTPANQLAYGLQAPHSSATDWQSLAFMMRSLILRMRTADPVEVIAVHGGGLGPIGTVDVKPLVMQQDGAAHTQAHGVLYGLPYIRWQEAGGSAVILDPSPGTVGLAVFCSRDISAVKQSLAVSPPSSRRTYNLADGIFVGCCLSLSVPTQYIAFAPNAGGITIVSPENITINGVTFTPAGEVIDGNGVVLGTHLHTETQPGSGESGPPQT